MEPRVSHVQSACSTTELQPLPLEAVTLRFSLYPPPLETVTFKIFIFMEAEVENYPALPSGHRWIY